MPIATSKLLLKFRARDAQFGVTRDTVKAMAERFDISETDVVQPCQNNGCVGDLAQGIAAARSRPEAAAGARLRRHRT